MPNYQQVKGPQRLNLLLKLQQTWEQVEHLQIGDQNQVQSKIKELVDHAGLLRQLAFMRLYWKLKENKNMIFLSNSFYNAQTSYNKTLK